jgi:hypothetical protein
MELKYLMFDEIFPVIFPDSVLHNQVSIKGKTVTSAGYIHTIVTEEGYLKVQTYGESMGLKKKPSNHDADILTEAINQKMSSLHGILAVVSKEQSVLSVLRNAYLDRSDNPRKKVIAVDIDGTITVETEGHDYPNRTPRPERIAMINKAYDAGNVIIYYSARWGEDKAATVKWLEDNGAKYHGLVLEKLFYDMLLDDKAVVWKEV